MATDPSGGGNSTESTTDTGAAQTGEFKVPDGKVLLDAAEHTKLLQNNERVRGMQPYYERGSKYGIKKPEDFEPYGKLSEALKARKLTLDEIMSALTEDEKPTRQDGPIDVQALRDEIQKELLGEVESRFKVQSAKSAHDAAVRAEQELVRKFESEVLGDQSDDWNKAAFAQMLDKRRGFYDEGHPLEKEAFRPYDEKSMAAAIEEIKKVRATIKGADLHKKGKEGAKPAPTPAGPGVGSGRPKDDETPSRPDEMIRADVERLMPSARE